MKFSSISNAFFDLCCFDKELLHNKDEQRPYLIIVRLKYNNRRQDFAIPFRSNISNYIPKEQYFSLPPRSATKKNKIHGLHYIKMFPINKIFLDKFHVDNDIYYQRIQKIISENKKKIIEGAQSYIVEYEDGIRPDYCTNIEGIYYMLNAEALEEVAATMDIENE